MLAGGSAEIDEIRGKLGALTVSNEVTIGVDFGTLSARAVVVRVDDGAELGVGEQPYAHGVLDRTLPGSERPLGPAWALQDPADWVQSLGAAVRQALAVAGTDPGDVLAIGTDFTACTVLPATADGVPLCELPAWREHPHAWPKLWKHHAAQAHADRINELAHERGERWIGRYGGKISAEWEYAKALQVLEEDPAVWAATERWIEGADWIVWQLTGTETRNRCTAGYKGIYQDGAYPDREFLAALNPDFADFPDTRLPLPLADLGTAAGGLCAAAAELTGLAVALPVAVGNVDAHVTAPAACAVRAGQLLAVMGTSTCHVLNSDRLAEVEGMCGVVEGGIVDGLYGYEAGQSAVGDIFAWWTGTAVPAEYVERAEQHGESVHELLARLGDGQPVGSHGLLALDWMGGNRSVLVDHRLSGVLVGLTLDTRAPDVYRALLEATAFGTRRIIDSFEQAGVPVTELVVAGGLIRNQVLMQVYADVCGRPLSVSGSEQGPALGSAIHAAVAAGAYPDVVTASRSMGRVRTAAYEPDPARHKAYTALYEDYCVLHHYFGRAREVTAQGGGVNDVLHRLADKREEASR